MNRNSPESHAKFRDEHQLPFPLLSDSGGAIERKFGATRLGGLLPFPKRVTFVADPQGVIRGVFPHELDVDRHVREVRECLERFTRPASGPAPDATQP